MRKKSYKQTEHIEEQVNEVIYYAKVLAHADDGTELALFANDPIKTLAASCEAARRVLGFEVHPNQIYAALTMTKRCIIELPTGEGKTLSAVLTAILLAHEGKGVHILTFNDYLAERDYRWMGPIAEMLGKSTGFITSETTHENRKKAYDADITWLTARESGFDHLRDGLVLCNKHVDKIHESVTHDHILDFNPKLQPDRVQKPYYAAILDEADSLLIDEARIPMVLAGELSGLTEDVTHICRVVASLSRFQDIIMDKNDQQVTLSDLGIEKIERELSVSNLYNGNETLLLSKVHAALTARFLVQKDRDYIVRDGKVLLVDAHTGRISIQRHWPALLQEAVEVKENLHRTHNGQFLGTVTTSHFMSLYPHLSGMTGTAVTSKNELKQVYNLDVVVIPPHKPCIRVDKHDVFFPTKEAKWTALCHEIINMHRKGRPVLIGTTDVKESETIAKILSDKGLPIRVLNAKNDNEEAAIIAEAGKPGSITVSTNMAGRGVDIRLGGSDESDREKVVQVGGLLVLGTSLHEHRRVDQQLRGRAGRQGDPGESCFYISLEDEMVVQFGMDKLIPERTKMQIKEGIVSWDDPVFIKTIHAGQRMVEGYYQDMRYQLAKYAEMPEQQRQIVRKKRMAILSMEDKAFDISIRSLDQYNILLKRYGTALREKLSRVRLKILDNCYTEYLEEAATFREGVHLASFGNQNPLDVFHGEIVRLFEEMWIRADNQFLEFINKIVNMESDWTESDEPSTPSSTWTYLVLDTPDQFSRLPQLVKGTTAAISAPMLAILAWWDRRKWDKELKRNKGL